ncbi:MAG: hypothetical protein WC782_08485 [Methylococcaceae bacterium]|jgi:V/A-type H+-transporting ATPase subunit E
MNNTQAGKASSGVEALIDRLKEEGVASGQEKAESIVLEAQKRADWIIKEAQQEAELLLKKAQDQALATKLAGEEALKLAARDSFIQLHDKLARHFKLELQRVVGKKMAEQDFLDKLILALAGQVREKTGLDDAKQVQVQFPKEVIGTSELRSNTEELEDGQLSHYVVALTDNLLRAGIELEVSENLQSGLSIKLVDEAMEIDFSDEAVTALLLEHLQPRFQALLDGIIKC